MSLNLSISEQITYSTVRIECWNNKNDISTGTGYFFKFSEDGKNHIPAIVTNKHVVKDAFHGKFHLTLRKDDGNPDGGNHIDIRFDHFENLWIPHPDDNIDLTILPIAPLLHKAQENGQNFFYVPLAFELLPDDEVLNELTALEDIIMVGYPNGIWDEINNLPIIRKGVTATHPNVDYNGKPEFMIDAACFPGSSGSPVLLFNLGDYTTKTGTKLGTNRIKLLGTLYAGPPTHSYW